MMAGQERSNHIMRLRKPAVVTAVVIVILFGVSFVYYYCHTIINDGLLYEINSSSYVYEVEKAAIEQDELVLQGWCFHLDEDLSGRSSIPRMRVLLADRKQNRISYFDAGYGLAREDVNAYFLGEKDYTYCGFEATIDLFSLKQDAGVYEIYLQPDERNKGTVRTGLYLSEGKILYADPAADLIPDVAGTDLEEIVNNGKLIACRPEEGICVYQYGWKLYYIADEKYPFDKSWSIGLNVHTNHPECLPEERQKKSFEALGASFRNHEVTGKIDTGQYKAAVWELPVKYPVTTIDTGNWTSEDGWIWKVRFCPGLPE